MTYNSISTKKNTKIIRNKQKTTQKIHWKEKILREIRWEEKVVQVQRVSKVMKGGKKLSFRTVIVIGNHFGKIAVGVGKADEVIQSIAKARNNASKNFINIVLTKRKSIFHSTTGVSGSAKVFIKPAGSGTGVIAGSSIRVVLELSGLQNILAKQLGSKNILNNARATIEALKCLNTPQTIANQRNISFQNLYQSYL
jgi:small subunit ribosomal protein S5